MIVLSDWSRDYVSYLVGGKINYDGGRLKNVVVGSVDYCWGCSGDF